MGRLVLEQLDCWYGRTHAVDQIDLAVEDGELCVLLGPSGCGKTSTLRMVAGFVRPRGGEIYLDAEPISQLYPGRRNIAMVFQSYALYPHKTVWEHFAFPLQATRASRAELAQRVEEMAGFLQMRELLRRYPQELSAGEQQRVAIGRALIRRPGLFLLDEPLANLDARLRVEMRASLRRLQQDLRITTVYVTHDQVEAQALGDKVVVMNLGHIQQVGTPQQVYNRPVNLFVAGFIGTPPMNFLECRLEREGGRTMLRNGHFALPLPPALVDALREVPVDRPLVLGVRPEHLSISPVPRDGSTPCEVFVLEPQGNELIIDVRLGDQVLKARADRRRLGFKAEVSQRVWFTVNPDRLHVFDRETEQRVA
jgi:multiple sugar transport system ATP-binding protein